LRGSVPCSASTAVPYDSLVRISAQDLQSFANTPAPLPATVAPELTLVEELVLLSLDSPRNRLRQAVSVAARAYPREPQSYYAAVSSLVGQGMLARTGKFRALPASAEARIGEREARVFAVIRRAAAPVHRDAELLVLLAATRALKFAHADDHMKARVRIASIGKQDEIPVAVASLCTDLGAASMTELADILLPAPRDLENANFDPGIGVAWMGG
jgi:hypothetical protein